MNHVTRLLTIDDTAELTELLRRNRDFLRPWDPERDDEFFSEEKQAEISRNALEAHANGSMVPLVIQNQTGGIAGRLNINGIVRGAFQSASLGYWVSAHDNGAGLATKAVADAIALSRGELGLHRLQAETIVHNVASQRVLQKNGFVRYGLAPNYLKISGRWQDHVLYQHINEEDHA